MRQFILLILVSSAILSGCGIFFPPHAESVTSKIVIQRGTSASCQQPTLFLSSESLGDFGCYVVKVSGEGVSENALRSECSITSASQWGSAGQVTSFFKKGDSIKVKVNAGLQRRFELYGVFPFLESCDTLPEGEVLSGYYLGSVTQDLLSDTSVVITAELSPESTEVFSCAGSSASGGTSVAVAPVAPTDLILADQSLTKLALSWTDNATDESGYEIESCAGAGCTDFVALLSSPLVADSTSVVAESLLSGETYRFRVRAVNDSGNSEWATSEELRVPYLPAIPGALPFVLTSTTAFFYWLDNADNETGYEVQQCAGSGCTDFIASSVSDLAAGASSLLVSGLVQNGTYRFRVRGKTAYGTSDWLTSSDRTLSSTILAAGQDHACATVGGVLKCWGRNIYGQLGNQTSGDPSSVNQPTAVYGLGSAVASVSAGGHVSCALVGESAKCWGYDGNGQLGNSTTSNANPAPLQVAGLTASVGMIASGGGHTCAIVAGAVKCWGNNFSGQLGIGTSGNGTDSSVPVGVSGIATGAQSVAVGSSHTCAVVNGAAKCWGYNNLGQLGDGGVSGLPTPQSVVGLSSGVQVIAAGSLHSCALVNGGVWCWGSNTEGQLGNGSQVSSSLTPVAVTGLSSGVQALAAGSNHTCALSAGGLWCWGSGAFCQLGSGANCASSNLPVQVVGLTSGVQAVAAGSNHTCAMANGAIYCWGYNVYGQLGQGATPDSSGVPLQVSF